MPEKFAFLVVTMQASDYYPEKFKNICHKMAHKHL